MKQNKSFTSQSGKSLVELAIVLVVATILATFAIGQFSSAKKSLERQNIVREFKVSLERARFDSTKRRAVNVGSMANITISNATSFAVTTDLNQNGTIDAAETRQINFADSGIKFIGNNLNYPITIRFDRNGFVKATNGIGQTISPNFTICKNCTVSTISSANANSISVSPTGTVLMTDGGNALPTLESPQISTVNADSEIKDLVTVK